MPGLSRRPTPTCRLPRCLRRPSPGVSPVDFRHLEDRANSPSPPSTTCAPIIRSVFSAVAPRERVCGASRLLLHHRQATVVGYTLGEQSTSGVADARSIRAAGCRQVTAHNAYGLRLCSRGLGRHYGAEKLAARDPDLRRRTERQFPLIHDFDPDIIMGATTCWRSSLLPCQAGLVPRDTSLKVGILAPKPGPHAMRRKIEREFAQFTPWISTDYPM